MNICCFRECKSTGTHKIIAICGFGNENEIAWCGVCETHLKLAEQTDKENNTAQLFGIEYFLYDDSDWGELLQEGEYEI